MPKQRARACSCYCLRGGCTWASAFAWFSALRTSPLAGSTGFSSSNPSTKLSRSPTSLMLLLQKSYQTEMGHLRGGYIRWSDFNSEWLQVLLILSVHPTLAVVYFNSDWLEVARSNLIYFLDCWNKFVRALNKAHFNFFGVRLFASAVVHLDHWKSNFMNVLIYRHYVLVSLGFHSLVEDFRRLIAQ